MSRVIVRFIYFFSTLFLIVACGGDSSIPSDSPPVPAYRIDMANPPCGGAADKLWSWAWAGENGENVTTKSVHGGLGITQMQDLSGNGNHYFNDTGEGYPGHQMGLSEDGYSTSLPIIALDHFSSGVNHYKQWMQQNGTMSANDFYLAFAGMNTRSRGERELWGTSASNNVWLHQEKDRVYIVINGVEYRIADTGALPKGPILLEIWRDTSDTLHTWVNGQDVSIAGVTSTATFSMNGIGWDQGGSSYWDDYAFEFIACDSQPTADQRSEVREYLRSKWNLYSASPKPMKPEDLTVSQLRQDHIPDNNFL